MDIKVQHDKVFQDETIALNKREAINGSWINDSAGPASYLYHHLHRRQANQPPQTFSVILSITYDETMP